MAGDPRTEQGRRRQLQPLLEECGRALQRRWEPGKEREEGARWGLAWTREDQIAARVIASLRAAHLDGDPDRACGILREAAEEYEIVLNESMEDGLFKVPD